jgi:AraC-like DNA-binding protein
MHPSLSPVSMAYRYISDVGKSRGHPTHLHPTTIEICYLVQGHMHWWFESQTVEMLAGDLMVVPVAQPHGSLDLTLEPCQYVSVQLLPERLSEMAKKATLDPRFPGHHPVDPEAGHWVEFILGEFSSPDCMSVEALTSLVSLLLIRLSRQQTSGHKRNLSNFVYSAQAVLQEHAMARAPVDEACRQLDVSKAWICQRFREELGCGPGAWLRIQRLSEAKRMLCDEGISINETAKTLGFSSSQHFSSGFRRETGMSPTQYIALRNRQSADDGKTGCLVVQM